MEVVESEHSYGHVERKKQIKPSKHGGSDSLKREESRDVRERRKM